MPLDAWLPIGFKLPNGTGVKTILFDGGSWQIYGTQDGARALVAKESIAKRWFASGLLQESMLLQLGFTPDPFYVLVSGKGHALCAFPDCKSPNNKNEAVSFAVALRQTRLIDKESSLHDAIYVEKFSRLLPTFTLSPRISDDVVFGAWLTGGVQVSVLTFRRLRTLMGWMEPTHLRQVVEQAGFLLNESESATSSTPQISVEGSGSLPQDKKPFSLVGRPGLEKFFLEHVIDIIENQERYKAFGIEFPSAIVLHGPPGCGKTFAVKRLVEYLGWPSFEINSSSIGSPYIHETGRKISEVFEKAMQNSPAVVIIDEMESFLADRQMGLASSTHRIEEVAEFLRLIPEVIKNHVLIVAMTNRIEMIDPAILRRGRFDHIIKVDMASEIEVESLLRKLVAEMPCEVGLDVVPLVKLLTGRPLSDVAFVVREAAWYAAKSGRSKLDNQSLQAALEVAPKRGSEEEAPRRMGFIWD